MLVLSRRKDEVIWIGGDILLTVVDIRREKKVRLGIEAPSGVKILRGELVGTPPRDVDEACPWRLLFRLRDEFRLTARTRMQRGNVDASLMASACAERIDELVEPLFSSPRPNPAGDLSPVTDRPVDRPNREASA